MDTIHEAGGVASMAHPGVTRRDELIAPLVEHGMDAIEVYHSDHSPEDQQLYKVMAQRLGVLVSGGSDFHGDDPTFARATVGKPAVNPSRTRRSTLGVVLLPPNAFAALEHRASSIRPATAAKASTSAKATADKTAVKADTTGTAS